MINGGKIFILCLNFLFNPVQDKNLSEEDSDNIDWDTEDELEIQDTTFSSCRDLRTTGQYAITGDGEVNAFSLCLYPTVISCQGHLF